MSNASKGAALEREAVRILEALGFLVHRTIRTPILRGGMIRGSHSNDVFNAFDIVAMKKQPCAEPDGRCDDACRAELGPLLMVQVTTKEMMRARERKVLAAVGAHVSVEHVDVEVWGFVGGQRTKGGQRFRRTLWNGLEWADMPALELLAKESKGAKRRGKPTKDSSRVANANAGAAAAAAAGAAAGTVAGAAAFAAE